MDDLLQQGIATFRAGKHEEARKLLFSFIKQNPNNEHAWGWLFRTCSTDQERSQCLQQVLRINPKNVQAKQLLEKLPNHNMPLEKPVSDAFPASIPPPVSTPVSSSNPLPFNNAIPASNIPEYYAIPNLKKCPYCAEMIQAEAIICPHCRQDLRLGISTPMLNLTSYQQKKPKKWYMATWVKIITFLFCLPVWTLIVLDDPDSTTGVKVLAGILLVLYVVILCPAIYNWIY